MKFFANFFENVFKREVPFDKKSEIFNNGTDNAYPELVDRLISNSVTAKSAANIMIQYLLGKGYGEQVDNLIVNKTKNLTLIEFADDIAEDIVKHRGCFIHVNYNALYQIVDMSVMPYEWCRIGKKDSNDYNGKIAVSKKWCEGKIKDGDITLIDVFNPIDTVIDSQVEKAGGWDQYKGQILFINMDSKLIYPLSRIDAVQGDCDSEAQAAIYKNRILRKGFFGNTLVVTKPLTGGIPEYIYDNTGQRIFNPEYAEVESERKAFQDSIKKSLGADNAGGVLCVEMDFAGEKMEDAILIKQIEANLDDKIFSYTETSVRENILIAFNNLPAGLVKTTDSALFGNSGEAILEMKKTYWENTTKERKLVASTITKLLSKTANFDSVTVEPIKLIEDATTTNTPAATGN